MLTTRQRIKIGTNPGFKPRTSTSDTKGTTQQHNLDHKATCVPLKKKRINNYNLFCEWAMWIWHHFLSSCRMVIQGILRIGDQDHSITTKQTVYPLPCDSPWFMSNKILSGSQWPDHLSLPHSHRTLYLIWTMISTCNFSWKITYRNIHSHLLSAPKEIAEGDGACMPSASDIKVMQGNNAGDSHGMAQPRWPWMSCEWSWLKSLRDS